VVPLLLLLLLLLLRRCPAAEQRVVMVVVRGIRGRAQVQVHEVLFCLAGGGGEG